MKRTFFILISFALIFTLTLSSCDRKNVDCYAALSEVKAKLSIDFPIYSPKAKVGESGYCKEDFLSELYKIEDGYVSDFAVILASTLDSYGEIAVLLCYTEYDAAICYGMLRGRLREVITNSGSLDVSAARDAELCREGKCVILCAVRECERAMRIIRATIR